MELNFLEDEPKLILTYPHKSKFSWIYGLSMPSLGVVILILKHLQVTELILQIGSLL